MNTSGQIVGQLYGGCGYNINDVCDSEQNRTVDGAFAFYFNDVKQWLDPNGGTDKMHVHAVDLSMKVAGPNHTCKATVTIVDENNNPVEGATVTGTFSGDVSGTETGTTDATGVAVITKKVRETVTTFTFCVDNVTHSSYTYDSGANVETCDTY